MNNLTTRKIVLGTLMVLVLAFGVLGNADALKFRNHTSNDGDLRTVFQNQEFTIRVPVTLIPNTPVKTGTRAASQAEKDQADAGDTLRSRCLPGYYLYFRRHSLSHN